MVYNYRLRCAAQKKRGLFVFYDVYCRLCDENGLSPSGAAKEIGFNKGTVSVWKKTGNPPKGELLNKIAEYFHVSTDYLLEKEDVADEIDTPSTEESNESIRHDLNPDEIKFALFGTTDITDGVMEDVMRYARFLQEQENTHKQN